MHSSTETLVHEEALHGAAHALAYLHFRIPFGHVAVDDEGHCHVFGAPRIEDLETKARVAMAGPCTDVAVDLIEAPNPVITLANILFTWRDDLLGAGGGQFDDLIETGTFISEAAHWALAFVNENQPLLEVLAAAIVQSYPHHLDYAHCRLIASDNIVGVSRDALEAADMTFAGNAQPFENIAEAVGQIERGELFHNS